MRHVEFGEGVVVSSGRTDFVRVFFGTGEQQVPVTALSLTVGRAEYIVQIVAAVERRNRRAWLAYQAYALPLQRVRQA